MCSSEHFPDCFNVMFFNLALHHRGGDQIYEMFKYRRGRYRISEMGGGGGGPGNGWCSLKRIPATAPNLCPACYHGTAPVYRSR